MKYLLEKLEVPFEAVYNPEKGFLLMSYQEIQQKYVVLEVLEREKIYLRLLEF